MTSLKKVREAQGLSQRALAARAGIAQSLLSDFETGRRKPYPKARRQLARALKTPITTLFPEV